MTPVRYHQTVFGACGEEGEEEAAPAGNHIYGQPDIASSGTGMYIKMPKEVKSACTLSAVSSRHAYSRLPYRVTLAAKRGSSRVPAFTCTLTDTGHGQAEVSRKALLAILQKRTVARLSGKCWVPSKPLYIPLRYIMNCFTEASDMGIAKRDKQHSVSISILPNTWSWDTLFSY